MKRKPGTLRHYNFPTLLSFLAMTLNLLLVTSCSTTTEDEIKAEVISVTETYIKAWKEKDIRLFEDIFYAGPELSIYEVRKIFEGWEAWETRLVESFVSVENVEVQFRNTIVHIGEDGQTAWLSTIEDATWLDGGESREVHDMRVTWSLINHDGQWKIIQGHWSIP